MSRPGPAPKPTALRVIEGNPSHRPLPENEPKPEIAIPSCPRHLRKSAKAEWRRITKHLKQLGLLTEIDRAALAAYCQAWARWVEAEEKLNKIGDVVESHDAGMIQNTYLSVANKALDQMVRVAAEFGMTPSSRTRVQVPKQKKANEFAGHGKRGK